MKNITNLIIGALFAAAILFFADIPASAQDPTSVDAKHYKVEFENDQVRVLRASYGPKEKSVMHQHPDAVAVSITGTNGKFSFPDGKSQMRAFKAGQVKWSPAETHLPQNLSAKPFQVILVELKGQSGGAAMPAGSADPIKADPKRHKLEFENNRVRVIRFKGGPGEKQPMHGHPGSVAIYLTNGRMKFTYPDGKTSEATVKAGQAAWRDAVAHTGKNLGKNRLEAIIVEMK